MNTPRTRWRSTPLVVLALTLAPASLLAEPGFGTMRKRKVELTIRKPAKVRLAHTSIALVGGATSKEYSAVLDSLLVTLETELISNEKTLVKKNSPSEAEWTLVARVTGYTAPRSQPHTQQIGNTSVAMVHWTGSLNVAYQVLDKAGHSHDAGNVRGTFDKDYDASGKGGGVSIGKVSIPIPGKKKPESAPQSPDDVKQLLIQQVVKSIATDLGNTADKVDVQIAAGEDHMNRAADFMEKHLWSRASDELEAVEPFKKMEDESYRQYDLGLVHEAMAYDAKTVNDQKANLFKAQEYYDKALGMNRKEKYFVETIARTRDSTAGFKALEQMQRDDQKAPPAPVKTAAASTPASKAVAPAAAVPVARAVPPVAPAAAPGGRKRLRVNDAIEMASAGVPEDQIIAVIDGSPVDFDPLDKDTVVAIARAKLSVRIQNALRKKVSAPPLNR
jgi:hypothetical protein